MRSVWTSTLVFTLFLAARIASGQALPTASRVADVQAGVTYSNAKPDYTQDLYNLVQPNTGRWNGFGAYANIDFKYHFGLEFDFHHLSGPDGTQYERTFEVGGRYLYPIRERFIPYAKVLVGRGIFNFAALNSSGQAVQIANLAYNTTSFGGGLDVRVLPGLNVRVIDYEYQRWSNFPPKSLNPQILSVGVAYHFHGVKGLTK